MKKNHDHPVIPSKKAELLPDLLPENNVAPEAAHHIHLMGICGTGMASLAGMLKQKGYRVSGSDQNVYPPISLYLKDLSIPVLEGYDPKNLDPEPDLVIVGNVITRQNPEAIELARRGLPYLSMPQALKVFAFGDRKPIVVSGTHGKTTTTGLAAWMLEKADMDPGFMVGGILRNFDGNFKVGQGPYFVIEGDEYDTAFFDKGPKFLHYAPRILILTSIEFDHGDIYRDLDHVIESFAKLIRIVPPDGAIIANGDDPIVTAETGRANCPVIHYGLRENAGWHAANIRTDSDATWVDIDYHGVKKGTVSTPLYGRHNISNLLSIVALSDILKIDPDARNNAFSSYLGVKRRQEIIGEARGVLILDDFAHHPTAVRETIRAVKEKYPSRRLIAVFEPRSNSSRRRFFQDLYPAAFDGAQMVLIPEPPLMEKIPPEERFSSSQLVDQLKARGLNASYSPDTNHLLASLLHQCRRNDLVLIMSNGAFDNLPTKLLKRLDNI